MIHFHTLFLHFAFCMSFPSIELPCGFLRGPSLSPYTLLPILTKPLGIRRPQMDVKSHSNNKEKKPLLDAELDADWGTPKLRKVATNLLSYKAPINFLGLEEDEDEADGDGDGDGDVDGRGGKACISEQILKVLPKNIGKKKAAVLVCLFQDEDGKLRVILSRRAKALSSHSGEVALPGGKRDKEDANNAETALREAREEIGLDSSLVRVVACIEPFLSKHLLRVTPVVALVPDRSNLQFTLNPSEVDAVFDAPLEMFLKDQNHRCEEREWVGLSYRVHYFDFVVNDEKYLIWGLTASILIRCASIVYQRSPEFVDSPAFVPITNHVPIQSSHG